KCGQKISHLRELFGLNQILCPADLPGAQIFLGAVFLQAFGGGESVLLVFQDALVDWRAFRQGNPRSVRKVGENPRGVRSERSQIDEPWRGRGGIPGRQKGAVEWRIGAVVSIAAEIGAKK